MNIRVTTSAPAGALGNTGSVIHSTIKEGAPARSLLLEVTSQTKIAAAFRQHAGIDRPMRLVANNASFPQRLVFVDEGAFLSRVTLEADVILGKNTGAPRNDGVPLVGLMTINATHFARQHGMTVRKLELPPFVEMALKTGFRRLARINNVDLRHGIPPATGLDVLAARTMAGLATHSLGILAFGHQAGMSRRFEVFHSFLVARGARLGADKRRAGNLRRRHGQPIDGHARNDHDSDQHGGEKHQIRFEEPSLFRVWRGRSERSGGGHKEVFLKRRINSMSGANQDSPK